MAARLLPPEAIDGSVRGASFLVALERELQPRWGTFLEDCRTRLPLDHALNVTTRVATIELVVDPAGKVALGGQIGSGDVDFDRAALQVIAEAQVPPPPRELLSDDDRVHVRWLFARDRRQAGAATAALVDVQLPVDEVVDRMLANGELERAARRVMTAQAPAAAHRVMIAALRESITSEAATTPVRIAAIEAIGRGKVGELVGEVRRRLSPTTALEVRIVAISAAAAIGDRESLPTLRGALASDADDPRLAVPETLALVALGERDAAAAVIASAITTRAATRTATPPFGALAAFAHAPTRELVPKLAAWFDRGDPRTRAAVCSALAGVPELGGATLTRGLRDADATVRALCIDVAVLRERAKPTPATLARLRELARDRDRLVRARAIAALVVLSPTAPKLALDDPPEVRTAFAAAHPAGADEVLARLAADPDESVRSAAIEALGGRIPALVATATHDASALVRLASVAGIADEATLEALLTDPSPEVATAAAIRLAARRGRTAMTRPSLERLIASPPASAERMRVIVAWLLAP